MSASRLAVTACGAAWLALAAQARAQEAPPLPIDAAAPVAGSAAGTAPEPALRQEGAAAEPQDVLVPCTVTGTSGASIFVDVGSTQGLEPGDRVRFEPFGRPAAFGAVRAVSSTSARVELESGGPVDVGDTGAVAVPRARLDALAAAQTPPPPGVPEHPPWTHPPEEWSSSTPLLAPSATARERRATRRGSLFLQYDATFDREGTDSTSQFARAGLDATWENLLARGETIDFDGEVVARSFDSGADSDDDARLRLQRLSYAEGGGRSLPTRWQAGRFLQSGFVEFGLLDGVEVTRRTGAAWHVGASLGLLPEPTFELDSGDDTQIALYARRERTGPTGLAYGVGYQKTFHDGSADRDLLAVDADWQPARAFTLHGAMLVDVYTSNERAKDSGLELTELHLFGNWRVDERTTVGLSHDRTRLPDIERAGFVEIPADVLREQRFERTGARVSRRVTDDLRLSARFDQWRSQDDDGLGGELRGDWSGLPWRGANLAAAVSSNQGTFSDVTALRLALDQATTIGSWRLAWELARNELTSAVVGEDSLLEQSLRASFDTRLGRTSLSLYVEQFFGDGQDATSLGLHLRRGL